MAEKQKTPRKPRVVDDWHDRLIIAAQARHTSAVRNNNRNQNAWKDAVTRLEKSRVKIYIPKSGQNAGNVVGIPAGINPTIVQTLTKIALGEEEVLLPQHEGRVAHNVTDESVIRKRSYRDSAYAILAALWLEYQGPGQNPQPTAAVQHRAQRFTDHEMTYDYRTRKQGAWKAKDDLKRKNLINEENNGMKYYSLTLIGAKACYHMFNEMFHPSKGPYELVQPRHGTVDKDGNFYGLGQQPRQPNTPQTLPNYPRTAVTPQTVYGGGFGGTPRQPPFQQGIIGHNNQYFDDEDDDQHDPYTMQQVFPGIATIPRGGGGGGGRGRGGMMFFDEEEHDGYGDNLGFDNNMGIKREPTASSSSSSSAVLPTANEALAMKRKRMLKLDPKCAEAIDKYLSWNLSEEEAWSLYEQGAEEEPVIKKEVISDRRKQSQSRSASHPKEEKFTDDYLMTDSQVEFELAIQMSKEEEKEEETQQYDDPEYLLALAQSTLDHQPPTPTLHHLDEPAKQPSRWKLMDMAGDADTMVNDYDYDGNTYGYGSDDDDSCAASVCSVQSYDLKRVKGTNTNDLMHKSNTVTASLENTTSKKRKLSTIVEEESTTHCINLCDDDNDDDDGEGDRKRPKHTSNINLLDEGEAVIVHVQPSSFTPLRTAIDRKTQKFTTPSSSSHISSSAKPQPSVTIFDLTDFEERVLFSPSKSVPITPSISRGGNATPIISNTKSVSKASKSSSRPNKKSIYQQSVPPIDAELYMYVDNRERKKNNTYRDFFKNIEYYVSQRASIAVEEIRLNLGDFMLTFVDPKDPSNRWVAEVAIERKCIDDIVSRSAEQGEGPHFRQERCLRQSELKYPCFLIEGEFQAIGKSAPRVSTGFEEENLTRLDVIQDYEELLGYLCGILSRNYQAHRVILLHTASSIESSIMLAAISVVVADEFDRYPDHHYPSLPMYKPLDKYWNGKVRNGRADQLTGELECEENISIDFVYRIERRFNEIYPLQSVYQLCQTSWNQKLLLHDLSLAPSNLKPEVQSKDNDEIASNQMIEGSIRTAELFATSTSTTTTQQSNLPKSSKQSAEEIANTLVRVPKTFLTCSSAFASIMGDMNGFPDHVFSSVLAEESIPAPPLNDFNVEQQDTDKTTKGMVIDLDDNDEEDESDDEETFFPVSQVSNNSSKLKKKSIPKKPRVIKPKKMTKQQKNGNEIVDSYCNGYLPWCEITKTCSITCNESKESLVLRSSSQFVLFIDGLDVIEALCDAVEAINRQNPLSSPTSSSSLSVRSRELNYVRQAWDAIITQHIPEEYRIRLEKERQAQRAPEILILMNNLGRGSGNIGGCGRLKSCFAKSSSAPQSAISSSADIPTTSSSSSQTLSPSSPSFSLDKYRKAITFKTAQELTSKLSWIVNLFLVVGLIEKQYQIMHCNEGGVGKASNIIATLANELHKNALLLYTEDD